MNKVSEYFSFNVLELHRLRLCLFRLAVKRSVEESRVLADEVLMNEESPLVDATIDNDGNKALRSTIVER